MKKQISLRKSDRSATNPNPFAKRQLVRHFIRGEHSDLASLTVPDQDLSLRQLLDNHTRGIGNVSAYTPVYNGDEYVPHPRSLDLTDLDQLRRDNAEKLEKARLAIRETKRASAALEKLKSDASKQPAAPPKAET